MKTPRVLLAASLALPLAGALAQTPPAPDTTLVAPQVKRVLRVADPDIIDAVRAADDERLAATLARDRARLEAILSDELHYAHSSGKVDTKASQIEGIVNGRYPYRNFEHKERTFTPVAPGVVLMTGRTLVQMQPPGGQPATLDLSYLAVWREENGRWRFLAWQSCRNAETPAAK